MPKGVPAFGSNDVASFPSSHGISDQVRSGIGHNQIHFHAPLVSSSHCRLQKFEMRAFTQQRAASATAEHTGVMLVEGAAESLCCSHH